MIGILIKVNYRSPAQSEEPVGFAALAAMPRVRQSLFGVVSGSSALLASSEEIKCGLEVIFGRQITLRSSSA